MTLLRDQIVIQVSKINRHGFLFLCLYFLPTMFHSCIEFLCQMNGIIGGICMKIDEMVFDNITRNWKSANVMVKLNLSRASLENRLTIMLIRCLVINIEENENSKVMMITWHSSKELDGKINKSICVSSNRTRCCKWRLV